MRSILPFLAVYAGVALLLPGLPAFRAAALVLAVVLALVDSFAFIAINARRCPAQRYRGKDLGSARSDRRHTNTSGSSTNAAETMKAAWHENINRMW
jgi:hypothetical protein